MSCPSIVSNKLTSKLMYIYTYIWQTPFSKATCIYKIYTLKHLTVKGLGQECSNGTLVVSGFNLTTFWASSKPLSFHFPHVPPHNSEQGADGTMSVAVIGQWKRHQTLHWKGRTTNTVSAKLPLEQGQQLINEINVVNACMLFDL